MLVLKGIKRNKLILYVSIIVLMVVGTSFFLYKNYTLTSTKGILIMDIPAEMADIDSFNLDNIDINLIEEDKKSKEDSDLSFEKKSTKKKIIDLSLLDNPKFKNLKETFVETINFDIGKRNPFEPY